MKRCALVLALAALAGCSAQPAPAPPPCPADLVLSVAAPLHGTPVEDTPGGRCLAARGQAGDVAAQLRLGDFYTAMPGVVPLIDRRGRQIHWYRLAGDAGSARGAWAAAQLIDHDPDRQMPNDALAYLFIAVKGAVPPAADYLIDQWQAGRIEPGKLWGLRQWLAKPGALPEAERQEIIAGLNAPTGELEPE